MNVTSLKKKLISAFEAERKAVEIYDEIWAGFDADQRSNIQRTLIAIMFNADTDIFARISKAYRDDTDSLSKTELTEIQCFHRSAMAFSRRKIKEADSVEALEKESAIDKGAANSVSSSTKTASSNDNKVKKERSTRQNKDENPEKLIQRALDLIDRDDVKALLQQALIQMKLTVTIRDNAHRCVTDNLNDTFVSDSYNIPEEIEEIMVRYI